MISYPPPKFEAQKAEILQCYQILADDRSSGAPCVAESLALALRTPFVFAALNRRYRAWYRCQHGVEQYSESDLQTYFARTHLAQQCFDIEDISEDEFFQSHLEGLCLPKIRALAGVPLTDPHGKRFGTLCVGAPDPRAFSPADLELLQSFGRLVSQDICVRSAARYAVRDLIELERERCDLFELATVDPLTKALNRRAFMRFSKRELARVQRDKSRLATLMLDIDHFKGVNDEHGHAVGDQVLTKLVAVATETLREEDLVGRLGGEEFAIVLIDTDVQSAMNVANRIRLAIKQVDFLGESGPFNVSLSIGVSAPLSQDNHFKDALARADAALYQAKRNGRDRVEVAIENQPSRAPRFDLGSHEKLSRAS